MKLATIFTAAASMTIVATGASAAQLYNVQFGTTGNVGGVSVTTAADVTGSSGVDIEASETFQTFLYNGGGTNISSGEIVIGTNGSDGGFSPANGVGATTFGRNFLEITVSADPGNFLDLDNVTFQVERGTGGTAQRGYEVYAETNGDAFAFGASTLLADVDDLAENRNSPSAFVEDIDLTGLAEFQGIESVTFRFYTTAAATTGNLDFGNFTVNGDVVVPEPTSLALLGLGGLLMSRRRRG